MMKKIRVGVIGQGRSGYDIHVGGLREMADKYEIAAVADPLEGRTDDAVNQLGAVGYKDYKEMMKRDDLDLIVNSSPSHLHVPISLEIMESGHNIVCEKPLARYASDVDKLIAKAKETGVVFTIYQQSRFAPYFRKIREVIDSGVLGRIVMVRIAFNGFGRRWDWQTIQDYNAGNLLNTGPHPLDQALQLFGTDAMPDVTCIMDRANTFGDAEDFVKLVLKGKDRPVIDLEISSCCAYNTHMYNIDGTLGGLKGTANHLDWKYYKPEEAPEQHLIREPLPDRQYCKEQLTWHEESWDLSKDSSDWFQNMCHAYYTYLYETLVNGAPLMIKPEEVRQQIAVIEECHRQNPLSRL
jgi:scyllo-inositol 2-dehydrogenase (NADP+)